ncbi:MAG: glycosyltransferase family 2 protein [Pseudomonadota bacterium]
MARSLLNVIILNYGTPDLTIASAESVISEVEALGGKLILVDNASPDDSVQRFIHWREARPGAPVELIVSIENCGFAAGNNLGLKAAEADFFVLLNSDTVVEPGAMTALLDAMRADPALGLAGPMILDEKGTPAASRFRKRTPLSEFVEATGLDFFYRRLARHVVPIMDDDEADFDWISFACIMLRSEMIAQVGFLDERYFMYFEDSAYSLKAVEAGWKIKRVERAVVRHFEAKSSQIDNAAKTNARLPRYFYAARARYFVDHYGWGGFIAANLLWYLGRAVNAARALALKPRKKTASHKALDIWIGPTFTP